MGITEFGKAVRKARIDATVTLSEMATDLQTTSSFLSALEMGRKKIPLDWAPKIEEYFRRRGVSVRLRQLADVANKSVQLEGLPLAQQMLVAKLARTELADEDIAQLSALLSVKRNADDDF